MPDPSVSYRFAVEISGIQEALFTECSGFETKIDVEEYKEGGVNDFVHKLPGRQSFGNITLKRGMTASVELWDWLNRLSLSTTKKDEKKDISVVVYDGQGGEKFRWNLTKAYPVKWSSPTMQTDQSSILVESLELTFQEFTLEKR
jgi:phage tail-like protein